MTKHNSFNQDSCGDTSYKMQKYPLKWDTYFNQYNVYRSSYQMYVDNKGVYPWNEEIF